MIEIFGSERKRGRSLNLIHFLAAVQQAGRAFKTRGSNATRKDLSTLGGQLGFIIKKAGRIKKISGAFIGNEGRTIFRRVGRERLPIKPVRVIGFSQMFNSRRISGRVVQKINAELPIEIERALKKMLKTGQLI